MMEIPFTVDSKTSFEEKVPEGMDPYEVPSFFARGKSLGFHRTLNDDEVLVTADTVVICDGRIMGKPHSRAEAVEMLQFLSGRTHDVVSAICVRHGDEVRVVSDTSRVTFDSLTDVAIRHYVDKYNPTDKAGGYGIQEWIGLVGISGIEGSFYTIMGLPTHLLFQLLSDAQ